MTPAPCCVPRPARSLQHDALPGASPSPARDTSLPRDAALARDALPARGPSRDTTSGARDTARDAALARDTSRDVADLAFMQLALRVGRQGTPAPNPHVGAVVVQRGEVVGIGHHQRAGEAHAEAHALACAGALARGATLYVTLEPCNHHGRTPPCVDAVLASGVTRVVIGCADPNPHVQGGGAEALRRAGIDVSFGPCGDEARELIAAWAAGIRR